MEQQQKKRKKSTLFSLQFFTPNHSSNTSKVISQSFRNCAYVTTAQMRRGVLGGVEPGLILFAGLVNPS